MVFAGFCLWVVASLLIPGAAAHSGALSEEDEGFCRGGLDLSYPDLDINTCMVIPQEFREKISREWGPPKVQLTTADKKKTYTLIMVDPDAPSRTNPTRSHWRHWVLVDIEGKGLRAGDVKGTVLSEYTRPTPPQHTGFHRYQFLLYEQPTDQVLSLSEQEKNSLGNWDPQAFVQKFKLEGPVTSLQFLTQNHKD
ncbi:phosphatidylethanolamine-binding protein 4 [Salminus brasiliensis]|uniref:phosphatidylethanolamine-binding protein 4 n=1 Tax=Salminus brasiliensis TaxID=930266 RepID=UPI003B831010